MINVTAEDACYEELLSQIAEIIKQFPKDKQIEIIEKYAKV